MQSPALIACPDSTPVPGAATGPIDWNCNGTRTEAAVVADVNADGTNFLLTGHADWPNVLLPFQCTAAGSQNAPPPGTFHGGGLSVDEARRRGVLFPPRVAQIEVMPGVPVESKTISLSRSAVISVAVFGAERFDVTAIDPTSLKFAGASPLRVETADMNGDGRLDLLLSFDTATLNLSPGAPKATLSGSLDTSQRFTGEAPISVAP